MLQNISLNRVNWLTNWRTNNIRIYRSDKKEQLGAHSARAKDAAGQEAGEVQHAAAVAGQCRQYVKYEAGNKDDQAPTQAGGEY